MKVRKRYKSNIIKRDGNIAISKHDYFGLDDNETIVKEDVTLMDEIIDQTKANEVSDDVRNIIN